ncbi:MAG: hypothetical protein U0Q18_36135 [Bryobacteraceae bacterium]
MNRRVFLAETMLGGAAADLLAGPQEWQASPDGAPAAEGRGKYYDFSADGKVCLIHRHDTPVLWANLLGNGRLVVWTGHDGAILESCLIHSRMNKLANRGSGRLYIRDAETGRHFLLNRPNVGVPWQAAQGLGYTRVTTTDLEWSATATSFVPRDDDVLLTLVSIRNGAGRERAVDLFTFVEWCLGDTNYSTELPGGDFYGFYNNVKQVSFDEGILYGENHCWGALERFEGQKVWPYTGFLCSTAPVKSFETEAARFFGRIADFDNPKAVRDGQCNGRSGAGFTGFPLGVLHHSFRVPAGHEQRFVMMLGIARERQQARRIRSKYDLRAAEQALGAVKAFWDRFTGDSVRVQTPEPDIDRLVNVWIKYQHRASMLQNLNTGRTGWGIWCPAYPYGGGRGSDIREIGNVPCDNQVVKEDLLDFLEGGPLLLKGDLQPKWGSPTLFQSDLEMRWSQSGQHNPYPGDGRSFWPYPVCWHIKETGDFSLLETRIEYRGQHRWAPPSGSGTIFESMRLAIDDALSGLSERGLPRMNPGLGDWNDALNLLSRAGKAESIMTAMELCFLLRECAELARAYNRPDEADAWSRKYTAIKNAINQHGWDGKWYARAFNDEGEPIGSSRNREGRIFIEPQAWAVLSGVATPERAAQCLESVDELLMTDFGPRICAPPYSQPDDHIGIVAGYAPGWRENGAIWNRPTGWTVMANCLAGRAEAACEMYRKASIHNPSRNQNIDRFWLPPYAYPEFLVGAGPDFGRGQFQWCIGKAGTMWRAYVYYILGVRPQYSGLLIDPQIPKHWTGFKVTRPFRGAEYDIEVRNPHGANHGVQSLEVDGATISGNLVPIQPSGSRCRVRVTLAV